MKRVRAWYVEATGDTAGADNLSPHAMGQELQEKAAPGEMGALQKRIAEERAGLIAPPSDLSKASAYERYYRALLALGDETERALAEVIGEEKAHKIRTQNGGWPMRSTVAGCPGPGPEDGEDGAP
jgi:hypothetical protein